MSVHIEVVLIAGYAVFLLACAAGLDLLARHAHQRSERYRTMGFAYHPGHDYWVCPEDQQLWPHEFDHERRLVRYRAKPSICNACPTKHRCTASQDGREITRPLDPWPHSEAGRFHRGIALVLVALAGFILVVEVFRHHQPAELALLGMLGALVGAVGWWLTGHFRRTPTNFPEPAPTHGLRLAAPDAGRHTRWGLQTRSMR